jgi:hypothetical protein
MMSKQFFILRYEKVDKNIVDTNLAGCGKGHGVMTANREKSSTSVLHNPYFTLVFCDVLREIDLI